jgi:sterol 3beta-glucosyltransferase
MLITILTMGSRGDVQPYLALGLALKKAGARVRVATLLNYEAFVTGSGLEYAPVQGDITKVMSSQVANNARQADNPLKFLRSFNEMKNYVYDLQKDFFAACQGADLIVYHPGVSIGYFAARQLGIPAVLAAPFPMTPTRAYPAIIFYDGPRLGGAYNLLTHQIFEKIFWMTSADTIKRFWRQEFGRAPQPFPCPYGKQTTATHPTVVSCSNYVFPRPADWPEQVHNTGFWFLDEPDWQPPVALTDFLERGPAPVYVGFGSVGDPREAAQTARLVAEALERTGQRGILATGWQGAADEPLPGNLFALESAPHAWLFPRLAAVVHHGGAGTTAAGLRAGVPSIVIPHGNDQFAWARRVSELGVGAKPIPQKKLTAENLAEAIQFVLKSEVRQAARALGAKIQAEDGAGEAAKVIINVIARRARPDEAISR